MHQIIDDFNARIAFLGISRQELAEKIHKELTTVNAQLNVKISNPKLSTLLQYCEALGGELQFVTPESEKAMNDASVIAYRKRLQEMGSELNTLRDRIAALEALVEEKDAKLQRRDATIAEHVETAKRLRAIINRKEEDISRKDARIAQLMDKILGE